ncbi:VOC family protein [Thermoflexus sp.]|uniref:VOC family protein n=1 Tax=Thermoflexus sp. TaxID=1969742 RepID=UPI0035E42D1C
MSGQWLQGAHIGYAHLQVRDLGRALAFYRDLLGFLEIGREGATVLLSATGSPPPLLILTELRGARPKPPRTTGLYHVAIRVPTRRDLARVFRRLLEHEWPFQGFSDHGVSEALYLPDPDGNGLEIYRDRPRAQWPWQEGRLAMVTKPLDVEDLLGEAIPEPWEGLPSGTDIGHIHLHVADLEEAERFYVGILGLEVTQRDYPGARFFAAGGYHHHVGTNIWAGRGAPPPPADAVGLRSFSLVVPDEASWIGIRERALAAGLPVREGSGVLFLQDPSANRLQVVLEGRFALDEALG